MSDRLEDLKRFIYDTLLEWTDFDPDGQISFLIDSRFSETERAIQSYIDSKIIEARIDTGNIEDWVRRGLESPRMDVKHRCLQMIVDELKALNHRKER